MALQREGGVRTEIEAHRFPLQSMAKDLWHKVADKEKSGKGVGSPPCSLPFTLISLHHSRCLAHQAKVLHDRGRLALFPLQSHVANPRRCAAPRFVLMLNHSPAEGTSRTPWAGCSSSFWGGRAASTPSANRMRLWPLPR